MSQDRTVLGSHDEWVRAGEFLPVGEHEIFWRRHGADDGRPVTLLHGFPTSSHDWAPVIGRLGAAGFRTTTLDFLGFGASAKPRPHSYRLSDQADLVDQLWAHLGVARTALVAHDYGVTVAQELLARDPSRITSMSYLNGGVYPELHRPIAVQRLLHGRLGPVVGRLATERTFRLAMGKITGRALSAADLHSMWTTVTAHDGKRVQHSLLHYIDERRLHRDRWVRAMETYAGPTQFVWGPADPISGAHVLEQLRRRLPAAHFTELPGVGHYPQVEAPADVAEALTQFLDTGRT